jgi:hypothetical protein
MARHIHIADAKGRDAEVLLHGLVKRPLVKQVTIAGGAVHTVRVLKGGVHNGMEGLLRAHGDPEAVAQALMAGDPEIDPLITGRFVRGSSRVFVDEDLRPVARVTCREVVHATDGSIKEERIPKETLANILAELPVKGGRLVPRKDVYNKLVFARKYQLCHVNGLTFDFLHAMAAELHEKDALMMVGAGPKGNEPLVFQDGGRTYRAYLEGRVQGGAYLLLLHLTNLELKPLPGEA